MCADAAGSAAPAPPPEASAAFLAEARQNLTVVYEVFGRQSSRSAHLVAHYRASADALGCRPALEQLLAALTPPADTSP